MTDKGVIRKRKMDEGNMLYSVDEAQTKLYSALAEAIGFKYLKSQRCIKKVVDNLIFEFDFYSNKWNKSGEKVNIEAAFVIMNKKYGKQRIDCVIAEKMYRPGAESGYWYDISTKNSLENTYHILLEEFKTAVDLCARFEADYNLAVKYLYENLFEEFHVFLDFVADTLGMDAVREKAKELYADIPKKDIELYKNNTDAINRMIKEHKYWQLEGIQSWMINRSNWKFIMDNELGI